jgi:peptidoglycan hydrolase CwlO-like protein
MDAILVKNKDEVVRAANLLEKLGINVFKDETSKKNYLESDKVVENNYLIKEKGDEEGWRIQSHFISDDTTVEVLEAKINEILATEPEFKVKILEEEVVELKSKITELTERLVEINKILTK